MVNPHKKFCASLTADERMLIALRDELYGGSWDQMLKDLQERLKGRPYIFKLADRGRDPDAVHEERLQPGRAHEGRCR